MRNSGAETGDKQAAVDAFCGALNNDTRVIEIVRPIINPDFTSAGYYYPDSESADSGGLLTGKDAFKVFSLSNPIYFKAHVPKKNQPAFHGHQDIPAEDYYVSWDGVCALVLWHQDDEYVPLSGGHIVADILQTALVTTGAELTIQSCSPDCENIFFHTVMRINDEDERPDDANSSNLSMTRHIDGPASVDVYPPTSEGDFDILEWLYLDLNIAVEMFAELKNTGRRILDIEELIRDELTHLLSHYYQHSSVAVKPPLLGLSERWKMLGWRREARHILAKLWLSMANIERLLRAWERTRQQFDNDIDGEKIQDLFARDYAIDARLIAAFDIEPVNSAIEQIAANLDNSAVVNATVLGALAGGLAGAIVGLVH